jgi:hypothetical protein
MWSTWYLRVMVGVSAPINDITRDVMWAWSNAESGADVMRWNNPLNTTQPWPNALKMNNAGLGVKFYATVQDGIDATVVTLLNGYYPVILANLRRSVPRAQWGNACADLGIWGTGCGWLSSTYGAPPGILGGDMFSDADREFLYCMFNVINSGSFQSKLNPQTPWLVTHLSAIEAAKTPDLAALNAKVDALMAVVVKIENALKAA